MASFIAWNPINLIEGEGKWVTHVVVVSFFASLITVILFAIKTQFERKKKQIAALNEEEKKLHSIYASPVTELVFRAVYTPLIVMIWYAASLYCFDTISDGLLSHFFVMPYTSSTKIGVVFSLAWMLCRLKNGLFTLTIQKKVPISTKIDAPTAHILSKLSTVFIVLIALVALHDVTGMSMNTVLAFGGVGSLAFAFASQDIIANFFSGFMIHITRPFIVGEEISVPSNQMTGVVEELGWYQTIVRSSDKTSLIVPNSMFSKVTLINKSRMTHRVISDCIYVKIDPVAMPQLNQELSQMINFLPGVDRSSKCAVWICGYYGPVVKIGLYVCTNTKVFAEFSRIQDNIYLAIAKCIAHHSGCIVPPIEAGNAWMNVDIPQSLQQVSKSG